MSAGRAGETVRDSAEVHAPIERLWALSTRVELVKETLGMNLAGGVTHGFVQDGSRVVWRGWKFGLPTEHHTLITGYAAPHIENGGLCEAWFQDSQERGRFAFFQHDHWLRERTTDGGPVTVLEDKVQFRLPFGVLGRIAAEWVMAPYVRRLVRRRFARLKGLAEGEGWREWV